MRSQRLQQLVRPFLASSGLAAGCISQQALLPSSARLQAALTAQQAACHHAVNAHLSSSRSCSLQECAGSSSSCSSIASGRPRPTAAWPQSTHNSALLATGHDAWRTHPAAQQLSRQFSTSPAAAAEQQQKLPPALSQTQSRKLAEMDFKAVTLGPVFDQYTHPVSYLEARAYTSWRKTKAHVMAWAYHTMQDWRARMSAKGNVPGYSLGALREEVAELYMSVQGAQAQMQPDLIRDLVAHEVFIKLRAQAESRRRQGWSSCKWELLDADRLNRRVKLVRARAIKMLEASPFEYHQFTFCITSQQTFAAYGKDPSSGRQVVLSGDPGQVLDVVEYCVFERKVYSKVRGGWTNMLDASKDTRRVEGSRWRLVAWLQP